MRNEEREEPQVKREVKGSEEEGREGKGNRIRNGYEKGFRFKLAIRLNC